MMQAKIKRKYKKRRFTIKPKELKFNKSLENVIKKEIRIKQKNNLIYRRIWL